MKSLMHFIAASCNSSVIRHATWAASLLQLCMPGIVLLLTVSEPRIVAAAPPLVGIEKREPWTTSRITGTPEPPLAYITERVFPSLTFNNCLDITTAPGSDRLFIAEQSGKIFSFVDQQDVQQADLVVDFAKEISTTTQVYALTFHPSFETNRYCYVCYINPGSPEDGTHVARFQMSDTIPPTIDLASELTIITWKAGGHNGCCLKFGPDGYLYISTGDAAPPNPPDMYKTGQDISDLLSSILRIDVDHADDGKNYRIPPDNPFVSTAGARGEVWAYGLRNPWRMSFDRKTGDLWVGDVGWELWEMLDRIERGGNYGWAVTEGRAPTQPEWPRGPTPVLPPTIDHLHSESSSITDGLTYYGSRLSDLTGKHIYGDYDTGKIWAFRFENGNVVDHSEIADTTHRIVGFGEDYGGELILLDHTAGTIHRLAPNPLHGTPSSFPRSLSSTGLFSSITEFAPAPGVVPYSINAEQWTDHARAERVVAVPGELSIKAADPTWSFPENSVLAKTLSLEMHHGKPDSLRRIETQILHFDGKAWMPYTYRWNDDQSDAMLVDAGGAEQTFEIIDPAATDGKRHQIWRFYGRAECQRCHNTWSGPALAFNSLHLNRSHNYSGITASQLGTFAHIRLIESPVDVTAQAKLVDPHDMSAAVADRARSYLHVNCSHCHRMHAGGSVLSHMHFDLPIDQTNMLRARPTQGTFGIHAGEVIAPGDPFRSVLLYRMAKLGSGRMPHIGSNEVDRNGISLIYDWVEQMSQQPASETTASQSVIKLRNDEAAALSRLHAAKTAAEQESTIDLLLKTTTGALRLLQSVDQGEMSEAVVAQTIERAAKHSDVSVRDLFERFLPAERRAKRLGSVVHPDQILSLSGDLARGRKVFFETNGVLCRNCHRIATEGKEIGPDLTTIGKKLTRNQLLESLLEPSKLIDPKYLTYLAETTDGQIMTGLLVEKTADEIVLKDAQDKLHRVPSRDIEQLVPQRQSLMPDLLVRDLTAQQVADLVEYLSSLK